jgi:Flp pilus assembly protein CpaB
MRITVRASTFFALFIAVLVALAAAAAARYIWYRPTAPVQAVTAVKVERPKILAARKNLYEGMAPTQADLQLRDMSDEEIKDSREHPDKYLPPTVEAAVLRIMKTNLGAGQALLQEHLEPIVIPPGLAPRITPKLRAVHVSVPKERSEGGLIRVDEYVDVLLTTAISGDKNNPVATARSAYIASKLRVILKRDNLWPQVLPVPKDEPLQFTLEANPYRAALIEFARTKGDLTLVSTPTPPLAKNAELKAPATFSEQGSKEYMNEDERVASLLRGDRTVGDADLERIFGLPPLVVNETFRVEVLNGNKFKKIEEFTRPIALADRPAVDPDQPGYGYHFSPLPTAAVESAHGSARPQPQQPFGFPLTKPK